MFVILFAGHDTTGHTMTWLTYELAKIHNIKKGYKEIDEFFEYLDGREMGMMIVQIAIFNTMYHRSNAIMGRSTVSNTS